MFLLLTKPLTLISFSYGSNATEHFLVVKHVFIKEFLKMDGY